MKKTFSMITAFLTAVFIMAGQCQNVAAQAIEPISNNQLLQYKNSCMSTILSDSATKSKKNSSIFKSMPKKFVFASGAGAWGTVITLKKDGSFTGQYHDSNMGETGIRYPRGTVYICKFSGRFSKPKRVNKYTYTMKLKKLKTNKKPGKVYYKNKIRYITSNPYGFDHAGKFMIYCPGIKMSKLPNGFVGWLPSNIRTTKVLTQYGIYNVKGKEGFVAANG